MCLRVSKYPYQTLCRRRQVASCHRKCLLLEVSDHCNYLHSHRFVANPIIDSARMGLSENTNVPSWSVSLKLNTQGKLDWFGSFLLLTIILSIFEEMLCFNCMLVIFFPLHILSLCKLEVGCAIFLPANFGIFWQSCCSSYTWGHRALD